MHRSHSRCITPQVPQEQRKSQSKSYVYLCLIRFRSSKNSMNSAKSQHPPTTIAIDATAQFMSLSSIAVPPHDRSIMVRAGKSFNEASRITLARSNKSSAVTLMSHLSVVHCTRYPALRLTEFAAK